MGSRLLRAAFAALLVALAIGVAQQQGMIEQRHLHQLHLLRGRLLQQPAVAAAAARLRTLFPGLGGLLPQPGEPSCSCGVSALQAGARRCTVPLCALVNLPPALPPCLPLLLCSAKHAAGAQICCPPAAECDGSGQRRGGLQPGGQRHRLL